MAMNPGDAADLTRVYLPDWKKNRERVDLIDRWYRGRLDERDKPTMPRTTTFEYRQLRDRAVTPWLKFIVKSLAQCLYVEGYRRSGEDANTNAWSAWQANGFDARQIAVHRSAISHGISYVTVLPGDPVPVIRGVSARKMIALYQDAAVDDWPMYALAGEQITSSAGKVKWRFRLYDDSAIYTLDANDSDGGGLTFVTLDEHDAGECPVVRFANEIDLEGRVDGEVEQYIDIAGRIDQDNFDRLVVQRFGSWVVRYISGMAKPETDEEARAQKLRLQIDDLLVADDPDTKFGTLPATPLDGYLKAREADIHDLAAISQTPPQDLLGQMINISAEALAAAEAGKMRKLMERQHTFGEAHEQVLRMAAHLMGDEAGAADFDAEVTWRDMESRSLAQVADALGKLASGLGIPPEVLWAKVPGLTNQDIAEAKRLRSEGDPLGAMLSQLAQAGNPSANGAGG